MKLPTSRILRCCSILGGQSGNSFSCTSTANTTSGAINKLKGTYFGPVHPEAPPLQKSGGRPIGDRRPNHRGDPQGLHPRSWKLSAQVLKPISKSLAHKALRGSGRDECRAVGGHHYGSGKTHFAERAFGSFVCPFLNPAGGRISRYSRSMNEMKKSEPFRLAHTVVRGVQFPAMSFPEMLEAAMSRTTRSLRAWTSGATHVIQAEVAPTEVNTKGGEGQSHR